MSNQPRALGGAPLMGDSFVRVVYLDEAGTSEVDGKYLVVGGVIVHGDHQLGKVRKAIQAIYDKHIPKADHWIVLHTADIFNGSRYFDKARKPEWGDVKKRYAILQDLANLIANENLWVTAGVMKKSDYPPELLETKTPKQYLKASVALTYIACLLEVDQWFDARAKAENCMIIAEDNNDTRQYIKEVHRLHQSAGYAQLLGEEARGAFPLRHVQEDPSFQEKRSMHPLILADFISFVWKRALMNDPAMKPFYLPWRKRSAHLTAKPLSEAR